MSALLEIEGEDGVEFLDKLHSFVTFEIPFPARGEQAPTTVRVPGFLACQTSTRFREANELMGDASRTELNPNWIFGSAQKLNQFEALLNGGTQNKRGALVDLFNAFVKWLYTSQLPYVENGYSFYDLMRLAKVLGGILPEDLLTAKCSR